MCDKCGKPQTPEEINEEINEMELEYLGSNHGAMRMKRIVTGMKKNVIAIAQEIELNTITEDGVTQENKTCVVYLTPDLLMHIVDFLGEDDDG